MELDGEPGEGRGGVVVGVREGSRRDEGRLGEDGARPAKGLFKLRDPSGYPVRGVSLGQDGHDRAGGWRGKQLHGRGVDRPGGKAYFSGSPR